MGGERDELRPSRTGSLFLAYDLKRYKAEARAQVLQQSLYWAGWVTALALAMWLVFHFLLTRRTARLVRAAEQLAAGNLAARSDLRGRDELGRLSRAFDAMALDVAETQTPAAPGHRSARRVQRELENSEARLQQILNNATAVVFVKDTEGRFLFVNRQWERLFHVRQADAVGKRDSDVLPEAVAGSCLSQEAHLPYERPGLSKEYLRGEQPAASLAARPEPFYTEQDIDVRLGVTADALRPSERTVLLSDGVVQGYDRLLLATGAAPRRLGVPDENLRGVHSLRTIEDADAIRSAASAAEHVVVVGGGWIGAEVAASLRQSGVDVSLVAATTWPLERTLGPEVGALFGDLHARHGVRLVMNRRVVGLRGSRSVEAVALDDGSSVAADLVVAGIGVVPRTALAVEAGIASHDGILVDATLETSVLGIFAAGDVASAWHPILRRRIRVEHWDNAKRQGTAVAAGLMGDPRPYERVPYFFSDQFDLSIEYTGFAPEMGSGRAPSRPRDRGVHGILAGRRTPRGRHAGQRRRIDEVAIHTRRGATAAGPGSTRGRRIPLESLLPAVGAGEAAA